MAIYLYYGADEYRRDRAVEALRQQRIPEALGGMGHQILTRPSLQAATETLQSAMLAFGELPFYEIHGLDALVKAVGESQQAQQARFIETLEAQVDQKNILFVADKIDKKLKLPKWLTASKNDVTLEHFEVLPFWQGEQAARQLIREAQALGIAIDLNAALLLCEHLGHALRPLITECEKLHVYTGGGAIQEAHVRTLTLLDKNAFSLMDAWLEGRLPGDVVQQLNSAFVNIHPLQFLTALNNKLGYHYRLKLGLAAGKSVAELASAEGKKTYPVQKELEKIRGVGLPRIEARLKALHQAEFEIKRGAREAREAIETLLLQ